jgi:hypothetical protein
MLYYLPRGRRAELDFGSRKRHRCDACGAGKRLGPVSTYCLDAWAIVLSWQPIPEVDAAHVLTIVEYERWPVHSPGQKTLFAVGIPYTFFK